MVAYFELQSQWFHFTTALEDEQHYKAYQQALKEGVAIPLKYVKVLFFGPPQTGKTSLRRRLVGEIMNLAKEPFQTSTGTAEGYDVIIKLVEDKISDKISTSTTVITKSKWSNVKTLFGKEKSIHETELDEELRLLYQFIYGVVLKTENSYPVRDLVIVETAKDEALYVWNVKLLWAWLVQTICMLLAHKQRLSNTRL